MFQRFTRRFNPAWQAARLQVSGLGLGLAIALLTPLSVQAAERIRLTYGPFQFSITQADLETYAETGVAEGDLKTVLSRLGPGAQAQFQTALNASYDLDPVLANRFSYTSSGVQLLTEIGELVRTDSGRNGFKSLRAALTLAAADPAGLSLITFLEHLPTDMKVDVGQMLSLVGNLGGVLGQTQQVVQQLAAETDAIAATEPPVDFSTLPDPRLPGDLGFTVRTLTLEDAERDRTIPVDIYTPQQPAAANSLPVIVVSNGLGARRDRFKELAEHLATHGFALALLDHPGSDRERLKDFYNGLEPENFEPAEYLDRPQDVSFVLDELTRLNEELFQNALNPDQAGAFGYSFGGTTALALAGAEIDRDHLQTACETRSSLFNISLLYQCRALELEESAIATANLKDERIKAIHVFVPFSRSLYGPAGLAQVTGPVLWEAADLDILTPFVVEQMPAFSWLTASSDPVANPAADRYLTVTSGLPHARITLEVINRLTNQPAADWDSIRPIAEGYHRTLSTAFFAVHLANNEAYRPYLQARGAQHLTEAPYTLTWTETLPDFASPAAE
ncbi:MAG: alpha/beta fold hydrolase [Cyanobacteria bacterium J06623_4]